MWAQQQTLVKLFTVPASGIVDAAEKSQAGSRALSKRLEDAQRRLMDVIAAQLGASSAPVVAHLEPGAALPQLTLLGTAFTEAHPGRTIICAAAEEPAAGAAADAGVEGVFLVMGPADVVKKVGAAYAAVVGGRGGGRPGVFQGKAGHMEKHEDAVKAGVAAAAV
jgi:alanyl-tRNA synthetase